MLEDDYTIASITHILALITIGYGYYAFVLSITNHTLKKYGITQNMSREGNYLYKTAMENFGNDAKTFGLLCKR